MTDRGKNYFKDHRLTIFSQGPFLPLLSHWVFQSVFYLDPTERLFKLTLDVLGTVVFAWLLSVVFQWLPAILISFFFAHTLNFLFNAHVWVVLKFYGFVHHTPDEFSIFLNEFTIRVQQESSLTAAIVLGSLVRDELHQASDLDVRLLRKPGFLNGMQACIFQLQERSRAFLRHFPLDIYVIDDIQSLRKNRHDETAFDLITQRHYPIPSD
jgi:predicted nucleotidyltransferase